MVARPHGTVGGGQASPYSSVACPYSSLLLPGTDGEKRVTGTIRSLYNGVGLCAVKGIPVLVILGYSSLQKSDIDVNTLQVIVTVGPGATHARPYPFWLKLGSSILSPSVKAMNVMRDGCVCRWDQFPMVGMVAVESIGRCGNCNGLLFAWGA